MGPILAGAAVLVLLLILARGYVRSDARKLAKGFRASGALVLALAAIALGMTGRAGFAFILGGMAWALYFGTAPPWNRPDYGLGGKTGSGGQGSQTGSRSGAMTKAEALKVLGLNEGASKEEIRATHRRLILQTHPDKGGTTYLAAKINEAKDVLLGK